MKSSMRKDIIRRYSKKRARRKKPPAYEDLIINIIAVAVLVLFILYIIKTFVIEGNDRVKTPYIKTENVAAMAVPLNTFANIRDLSVKYGLNFNELLASYCLYNDFFPSRTIVQTKEEIEQSFIFNYENVRRSYREKDLKIYTELFENLLDEIKYFPVMTGYEGESENDYMFGESWGALRNYEGSDVHMGCDITDRENIRGRIAIASMTDGIINNIGWSEKGGFNIGIEGTSGNYYYYAHLNSFADGLVQGSRVSAGQHIGYMGDTGYGKKEGTKGNFPVHLHIGISPVTSLKKDFWINPYPFLSFVEDTKAGML